MTIYQDSPFYKDYLKKWKSGWAFSNYVAALGSALKQMMDTETRLISKLASLQNQLMALLDSIAATSTDLNSALKAQNDAGNDVAAAVEKAEGLKEAEDALRAKIASLEKKMEAFKNA